MTRLRHDLNFLSSAGLIVSGLATGITGLVSDLWDLNDFWYHTISGYVMGGFAVLHVVLNWDRLVGYARFRIRGLADRWARRGAGPPARLSRPMPPPPSVAAGGAPAVIPLLRTRVPSAA